VVWDVTRYYLSCRRHLRKCFSFFFFTGGPNPLSADLQVCTGPTLLNNGTGSYNIMPYKTKRIFIVETSDPTYITKRFKVDTLNPRLRTGTHTLSKKSRTHLPIIQPRRVIRNRLQIERTHNSEVTCELHCYLAFSPQCM